VITDAIGLTEPTASPKDQPTRRLAGFESPLLMALPISLSPATNGTIRLEERSARAVGDGVACVGGDDWEAAHEAISSTARMKPYCGPALVAICGTDGVEVHEPHESAVITTLQQPPSKRGSPQLQ